MTSTHDLIAGRCSCGAPVRLFCADCRRYLYKDEPHKTKCMDKAATTITICQCVKRTIQWGERPYRFKRPRTHIEDTLFELPPRVER